MIALPRYKFTVDDYLQLVNNGTLTEEHRIELIDGEIIEMSPKSVRHNQIVNRLNRFLARQLDERYVITVENTIRLSDTMAPEPDVAVLDAATDEQATLPTPQDIYLIAEVCLTSLDYDRRVKVPRYAKAGVPEVWVVNLEADVVEQYTLPTAHGYRQLMTHRDGDTLTATGISAEIEISLLLKK